METKVESKNIIRAAAFSKEKKYWVNKFIGFEEKTHFPIDFLTNVDTSGALKNLNLIFNSELNAKLKDISKENNVRLFIVLAANLVHLLYKYTEKKDIIIGIPIEKQNIKGELLNTFIPIRCNINEEMSFRELLVHVKNMIVEATENQNFPIETLPHFLNIKTSEQGFELFDVAIVLSNIHDKSYLEKACANFIFEFSNTNGDISCNIDFNNTLYSQKNVESIVCKFSTILEEGLSDSNKQLQNIQLLSKEEEKTQIVEFNNTIHNNTLENNVITQFENLARTIPFELAIISDDDKISYSILNSKANSIANFLKCEGIGHGHVVALMGHRGIDVIASILGVLKTGAAYLPINAQDPTERIKYVLQQSKTSFIILQDHVLNGKNEIIEGFPESKVLSTDSFFNQKNKVLEKDKENLNFAIESEHPAYVIYTSGTTGKPKGVVITHKSLINYISWASRTYVHNDKLNFPFYTSFSFDMSITSIFTPLCTGNCIITYGGHEKEFLLEKVVKDSRVDIVKATPTHLKILLDQFKNDSNNFSLKKSKIKTIIVGGENFETTLAKDVYELFNRNIDIFNEYGPTEATVGCMIHKFNPEEDKCSSVPIGKPIDNTQIYLLDNKLKPIILGLIGELYIAGDCLARGYLHNDNLTEERFVNNPFIENSKMYKTGDLARWLPDGNIEYLGRIDGQVKIRGFRIELSEIEDNLKKYDQIKDAVVKYFPSDNGDGGELMGYYLSNEEISTTNLRNFLITQIPDYMIPSLFGRIDSIPLTPSGKIDKKALTKISIHHELNTPPNSQTEKILQKIWSNILGLELNEIGIHTNFFELGGHSLSVTYLSAQIHKQLNVRIPLERIFKTPTIYEISKNIENSEEEKFIEIPKAKEKDYYQLTPSQFEFYFFNQLYPNEATNLITLGYEITGNLKVNFLEDALNIIVERHESLRTSIVIIDRKPVQIIHTNVKCVINIHTCSIENKDQFINEQVFLPIDFESKSLLKVDIIKYKSDKQVLLFTIPHIIFDGISAEIFINELNALLNNRELKSNIHQFKDYCNWQEIQEQNGLFDQQKEFWRKELTGEFPLLNLPYDYIPSEKYSIKAGGIGVKIDRLKTSRLDEFNKQYKSTFFLDLFTIFYILVYKITDQSDIVIKTIFSGRNHSGLEDTIGLIMNTLPVIINVSGEKTFIELNEEIKNKVLVINKSSNYYIQNTLKEMSIDINTSSKILSTLGFNYADQEMQELTISDLKLEPYYIERLDVASSLYINAWEKDGELKFVFGYRKDLFSESTIKTFIKAYLQIFDAISADLSIKITQINTIYDEKILTSEPSNGFNF